MSEPRNLQELGRLPDDHLVDVREIAIILGCSKKHVERMVKSGEFPKPVLLGRLHRWAMKSVRNFVRGGFQPEPAVTSQESVNDGA